MKKTLLLPFCLFFAYTLLGQDVVVNKLRNETSRTIKKDADTLQWNWKRGGIFNVNLAQGSLSNWAAGGDNFSLSIASFFNYYILHQKDKHIWDNNFDVNLAFVQTTSLGGRKNDDRFDLLSKYGYKLDSTGKWYLSGLFNLRSQFFDGYTYPNNVENFSSTIFSPAYIIVSAGFDYKPSSKLSIFLSPLTSRTVVVMNDFLSNIGAYGVAPGKNTLNELGAFATVNYSNVFGGVVTYKARMDIFSNYKNKPQNIDLFMTNQFAFKINKFFSATYNLDMIYDDDVRIFGAKGTSPGLQTKSIIGLGYLKPLNIKRIVTEPKKI
jgi:Protein of unknown function (DUF3078)